MITVQDFKKLVALQEEGCVIYCDGDTVSLFYNSEGYDDFNGTDEAAKYACTFTFINDHYTIVFTLLDNDYKDSEWTVKRFTEVNWRIISQPV